MNVIRFIARRYLFSRKQVSLISILTGISIAGITVGTALLIIVLSVFNGFYDVVQGFLLSFDPDIRIEHRSNRVMPQDSTLMARLSSHPDVVRVSPYIEEKAMLMMPFDQADVVTVRGIDPERAVRFQELISTIQKNSRVDADADRAAVPDRAKDAGQVAGITGPTPLRSGQMLINESLNLRYGVQSGDAVALIGADGLRRSVTRLSPPRMQRFNVSGIYEMQQILEGDRIYIDLLSAQKVFRMPREVSGYELELRRSDDAERVRAELVEWIFTEDGGGVGVDAGAVGVTDGGAGAAAGGVPGGGVGVDAWERQALQVSAQTTFGFPLGMIFKNPCTT